ncbi:DUF2937 family protein [Puniceibacterium sp. IMCC21224]|uniref:DUF2937 family protein n=1 Tax=Puniceibacterium sp. IMCC21224 TaxID=1618204 RepID=UPI00064D9C60|nr:DUF2937 family protein [Puniceibacterium sp. IMCC21224]KMK66894.1 Protein of unknown function (DUF2937) [Puniceibacterium sp. IMCC21224]
MILRVLTMVAGLTGAAGLSQFPEFSQQYTQRLGGAVDELSRIVQHFDRDAAKVGLTREEALGELRKGSAFGAAHAASMTQTISRHTRLSADIAALNGAGPFMRVKLASHLADSEIAERAWQSYQPAVPATFEGAVFAVTGFAAGWGGLSLLLSILSSVFRRKRRTAA